MKSNKKTILCLIFVIAFIIGYAIYLNINNRYTIINDYFEYINNDTLNNITIDENTTMWATINVYQEEVDKQIDKIAKRIIDNKENNKMSIIYNNYLDVESRNNEGIKPLKKYLDSINNSNDINSLLDSIYNIEDDLKINLLINFQLGRDFKDNSKYIVYFYPILFDFDTYPYIYNEEDYLSYQSLVQKYMIRLLKEYKEINNPNDTANEILDMKKDIASKSISSNDMNKFINYYNVISKEELQSLYSNINIEKYLEIKGLNNQEYSILDKGNYEAFNNYLTNDNLDLLKSYFSLRIIEKFASVLTEKYSNIMKDYDKDLYNKRVNNTIEDDALDFLESVFTDVFENEYSKESLTDTDKNSINNFIDDIIAYYKDNFNKIDWMSKETKERAINKLNNITRNVGYVSELYSNNYDVNENNGLFDNFLSILRYKYNYDLRYFEDSSKEIVLINTYTVNAFYDPQSNSINFPCAVVKFMKKDYYENLGSIGFIIAHEITHAFDIDGSKFNENGNFEKWWTDDELNKFNSLAKKVVDYYNNYEIAGLNVDGEKTLGENIADLGALKCISTIAEKKNASNEEFKKMYASFANFASMKAMNLVYASLMIQDVHSPNSIRVNATLSSTDKFYEVYDIGKNDDMYIDKNERVCVW